MPGSHSQQINEIMAVLVLLDPQSVLDVGVGFGKYGVLIRERLDLWSGADKSVAEYRQWQRRVDGVEAYADYLTPLHSFIYNQIFVGDACALAPTLAGRYDLVLLIDVIEHLSRAAGLQLLRDLRRISRNVLVSTPRRVGPQGPLYGNLYERHISEWRPADFAEFQPVFIPNQASLLVFGGEERPRVAAWVKQGERQQFRQSIKTLFPWLGRIYHFLK